MPPLSTFGWSTNRLHLSTFENTMYYELINICSQWINKSDHLTPMLMLYYFIQQSQPMRICVTISVRRANVRSVVMPSSEHITRKEITTVLRSSSSIGKVILSIASCLILQTATLSLSCVCRITIERQWAPEYIQCNLTALQEFVSSQDRWELLLISKVTYR